MDLLGSHFGQIWGENPTQNLPKLTQKYKKLYILLFKIALNSLFIEKGVGAMGGGRVGVGEELFLQSTVSVRDPSGEAEF